MSFLVPLVPVAHALIGRKDLPIPAWLFAWGAAIVLIVSFVLLTIAWTKPRLAGEGWRPAAPWLSRLVTSRFTEVLAGVAGVLLFGVVLWSGLYGTEAPDQNFALTFVYVTFWLGMVLLSVLFGDVFRAFNPWRAIGRVAGAGASALAGARLFKEFNYPEWLGRWPAAAGILGFIWMELIYGAGGVSGAALTPHVVAVGVLLYSVYTFLAMAAFGVEKWCDRGEAFSVYFNMYSRLSAFVVHEKRLGYRRLLSGAVGWGKVPGSLAVVVVAIGATAFDGAQEGAFRSAINSVFDTLLDAGMASTGALRLTQSMFLAATIAGVAAVYLLGVWGMTTVVGSPSFQRMRAAFTHTLIPIALAYLVAHYFSLFLFQEQAQFTYLLSDPLGEGSDFFGTASGGIDYTLIGATAVWYVQVGALVAGHVAGLVLGHDRALGVYESVKQASRSQQWMLAMMVLFTCFGLFLLSQANA